MRDHPLQAFQPLHARHVEVEQGYVVAAIGKNQRKSFVEAARRHHFGFRSMTLDDRFEAVTDQLVIIGQQNSHACSLGKCEARQC